MWQKCGVSTGINNMEQGVRRVLLLSVWTLGRNIVRSEKWAVPEARRGHIQPDSPLLTRRDIQLFYFSSLFMSGCFSFPPYLCWNFLVAHFFMALLIHYSLIPYFDAFSVSPYVGTWMRRALFITVLTFLRDFSDESSRKGAVHSFPRGSSLFLHYTHSL